MRARTSLAFLAVDLSLVFETLTHEDARGERGDTTEACLALSESTFKISSGRTEILVHQYWM